MSKRLKHEKRRYSNGPQTNEKVPNVICYQRNVNKSHNEIPVHTHQMAKIK